MYVVSMLVAQSISKLNRISLNFRKLLEINCLSLFLCNLTQKGVLFVAFHEFVEVARNWLL